MPKSNKKDRKENQALLKALGVKIKYEYLQNIIKLNAQFV